MNKIRGRGAQRIVYKDEIVAFWLNVRGLNWKSKKKKLNMKKVEIIGPLFGGR